ncbi:MAG: LacI family DNA-binding transcriptional regulator [Actinobacteria bacterium]|nr:LacI family DNA-binding transcriptional regulator [Actinomycetota bacterium]MBI3687592.1 LacI family DNA-binding transcriptional regulator [Actinomycetota bacterium]
MSGLAEIAAAAGVSISTVSRVLNRRGGVNDATRRRVLAVLADLPYTSRGVGALQRTGVIALLVPELSNPVFPAFAEALETWAARRGYSSVLCNTRSASMREEGYVRMLLARGIEGMVFVSPECTDSAASHDHYLRLVDEGVHMVLVNGTLPALDVPSVSVDEQVAGYAAARHLIQLGHRRIGFVSGPARSMPSRAKAAGWQLALEGAGLDADPALVAHAPYGATGGALAAGRLLELPHPPTGVICSSDLMAIGALSEAQRRGLRVPQELSVVGFDDIPMAQHVAPGLTTLAQPITEIARAAIDGLITAMEGAGAGSAHARVFRPRLVVRESTGPHGAPAGI